MGHFHSATIQELCQLSEAELQSQIVEPLLRKMKFQHVRDTSGVNDKGKDLVAIKSEFGKAKLYAIQIKKLKISGKHVSPSSLTAVVTQLRQLFGEETLDPSTNTRRRPDRALFITPFEIKRSALESAFAQLGDLERRDVTVIDGPILVDQVLEHIPECLRTLSVDLQYRLHIADENNKIRESSAFGVSQALELDSIYVDIALTHGSIDVEALCDLHAPLPQDLVLSVHPDQILSIKSFCEAHGIDNPRFSRPSTAEFLQRAEEIRTATNARIGSLKEAVASFAQDSHSSRDVRADIDALEKEIVYEVSLDTAIRALKKKAVFSFDQFDRLSHTRFRPEEVTVIVSRANALVSEAEEFMALPLIRKNWPASKLFGTSGGQRKHSKVSAMTILQVQRNVFVTGGPGAGKTTLLRRLSQQMARNSDRTIPIFISLVRAFHTSNDILAWCRDELLAQNYQISISDLKEKLHNGQARVFFDGLDETGTQAEKTALLIQRFAKEFPASYPVVSGRDTFAYPEWNDCVSIRIAPFDDAQLALFVNQWFASSPSRVNRLMGWLETNGRMQKAARTPIIAALLCSLVDAEADLPTTEVELYEERFNLLLGKWDQAKGIKALPAALRRRYWHFLTKLAFDLHSHSGRGASRRDVVKHAYECFSTRFHKSPEAMVQDCFERGLFEIDHLGRISFGHLTYQEFLAAVWLRDENPIAFIWEHLADDWWFKTFEFYACLKGDIRGLLDFPRTAKTISLGPEERDRIQVLFANASLTPESAHERFLIYYQQRESLRRLGHA